MVTNILQLKKKKEAEVTFYINSKSFEYLFCSYTIASI